MSGRWHSNLLELSSSYTRSSTSGFAGGRINFVVMQYNVSKVADEITFFEYNDWGISRTGQVANLFVIKQPDDKEKGWRPVRYPAAQRQGTSSLFPHRRQAGREDERRSRRLLRHRQKGFPADDIRDPLHHKEMQRSLTRNGENGNGTSIWLAKEKRNSYDEIELFRTKTVREVATTNGTASETDVAIAPNRNDRRPKNFLHTSENLAWP